MVNHLYFVCNLTLHYVESQPSSLWVKTSQHHLASLTAAVVPDQSPLSCILLLIISKGYQWKYVEVVHSHRLSLAPSKKRSRVHALTGQHLRYVRSESLLWWMQQES